MIYFCLTALKKVRDASEMVVHSYAKQEKHRGGHHHHHHRHKHRSGRGDSHNDAEKSSSHHRHY